MFVPVRSVIARRCGQGSCYEGSDLSLSADAVVLAWGRAATAAPPAGWSHSSELLERSGLEFGIADLLTVSLPALLLFGIVALSRDQGRRADCN